MSTPQSRGTFTKDEVDRFLAPIRVDSQLADEMRYLAMAEIMDQSYANGQDISLLRSLSHSEPTKYIAYLRELQRLILERLPYDQFIESVKGALIDQIRSNPALSEFAYEDLSKKIRGMRLVHYSDYLENALKIGRWEGEVKERTHDGVCGVDGMGTNAWKQQDEGFVVCPGVMLMAVLSKAPGEEFRAWEQNMFDVGHELGHRIDSHAIPQMYKNLGPILISNLKQVDPKFKGDPLPELTADFWGAELMAQTIRRNHDLSQPKGKLQLLGFLKRNLSGLCFSLADKEHPGGRARIKMILMNSHLRTAIGCTAVQPPLKECSL